MVSNVNEQRDKTVQFKEQFDLLSKNTEEYDITVPYIVKQIVDKLPQRDHFIDVGAGRGNLAKPLSSYFKLTTIVEPNKHFYREVLDWALENRRNLHGYHGHWGEAEVDVADCFLMSHVLYYVASHQWVPFVTKAYNRLNPGGSIIIILNNLTNGVTDLYKYFLAPKEWSTIASAEGVVNKLRSVGYKPKSATFRSIIWANTAEEAHELIDFLLLGKASFDRPEMKQVSLEYAESYLQRDGRFAINSDFSLITITKPFE